jgi:threonine dehydrogenase-like Zn-dependent dehydrogenase
LAKRGHAVTVFDKDPGRLELFSGSEIQTSQNTELLSGFHAIVEATGNAGELDLVLHRSDPGATILLQGIPYATREFTFESIAAYDKTVVGSISSGPQDFLEAISLLPELDLSAFLMKVLPLREFKQAWENTRQRKQLKVLLQLDQKST